MESDVQKKVEDELKRRRGPREKHEPEAETTPTKFTRDYGDSVWKYDLNKQPNGPIEVTVKQTK